MRLQFPFKSKKPHLCSRIIQVMFNNRPELEKDDFYYSEEGYIVFTSNYLLKRGYCCLSGCKHCPYGFDKNTGAIRKPKKKNTDE